MGISTIQSYHGSKIFEAIGIDKSVIDKYFTDTVSRIGGITLDDIADTLHVNRSYLSRYYKNKTGVNLFDEILMKRVEKAKEYLQNTEMKTYEISEAVGVEDAGYFSKMFKKITGVSPKEFRKREQHEEKN